MIRRARANLGLVLIGTPVLTSCNSYFTREYLAPTAGDYGPVYPSVQTLWRGTLNQTKDGELKGGSNVVGLILDLPFSLVVDTLMLPYDLATM